MWRWAEWRRNYHISQPPNGTLLHGRRTTKVTMAAMRVTPNCKAEEESGLRDQRAWGSSHRRQATRSATLSWGSPVACALRGSPGRTTLRTTWEARTGSDRPPTNLLHLFYQRWDKQLDKHRRPSWSPLLQRRRMRRRRRSPRGAKEGGEDRIMLLLRPRESTSPTWARSWASSTTGLGLEHLAVTINQMLTTSIFNTNINPLI